MEEEAVKDDQPTAGQKRKRGRPKKEVKATRRESIALQKADEDASENVADEEEATYQILDSVEDETVADQPPTGRSESWREENHPKNDDKQTKNSASLTGSAKREEEEDDEEEPMYHTALRIC